MECPETLNLIQITALLKAGSHNDDDKNFSRVCQWNVYSFSSIVFQMTVNNQVGQPMLKFSQFFPRMWQKYFDIRCQHPYTVHVILYFWSAIFAFKKIFFKDLVKINLKPNYFRHFLLSRLFRVKLPRHHSSEIISRRNLKCLSNVFPRRTCVLRIILLVSRNKFLKYKKKISKFCLYCSLDSKPVINRYMSLNSGNWLR